MTLMAHWTYQSLPMGRWELLEEQAADWLFIVRHRLSRPALDPRIALLSLDRESEESFGKPYSLWTADLAKAIEKCLSQGALAVGLDIAIDPQLSRTPGPIKEYIQEGYAELQDVLGSGKVVLIESDLSKEVQEPAWPAQVVAFAEDGRNSASANLIVDPDGTVRRIPVTRLKWEQGWVNHSWSVRLAEVALGRELSLPESTLRLDYAGPAGTFPSLSLARFMQGQGSVAGKIVLIVPDFPSDRHSTPFSRVSQRSTLGGEIHATAINSVLRDSAPRRLSRWKWTAVVAGSCLATASLGCFLSPLSSLLGSLALAVVYSLLVLTAFVQAGSVFPIWTSLMAAALGWVSGAASRLLLVEGQRQKVSKLLDRMVSRQVAEAVQGGSLERAERRQITLLFSDINGFTPTCERESPERVLAMLNRYFQEMVSLIDRHGGYVKQFVGDEIMAIYGAPKPTASHPRDAVLTAIAMLERLSALQAADPEGGGFYSAKIGINTGEAVLGSVGADERWEYAAVGDDVNLAARLESLTTKLGVDILVSKFTRDLVDQLPQGWSWKSLGVQQFKGKNSQLEVFTLVKE